MTKTLVTDLPKWLQKQIIYESGKTFMVCKECNRKINISSIANLFKRSQSKLFTGKCRNCFDSYFTKITPKMVEHLNAKFDFDKQWRDGKNYYINKFCNICNNFQPTGIKGVLDAVKNHRSIRSVCNVCYNKGYWINGNGYKMVKVGLDYPNTDKDGYILEHRYIVEQHLGRSLRSSETVHHIDGNRLNNLLFNLQLRQGAHGAGQVAKCGECLSYNIVYEEIK